MSPARRASFARFLPATAGSRHEGEWLDRSLGLHKDAQMECRAEDDQSQTDSPFNDSKRSSVQNVGPSQLEAASMAAAEYYATSGAQIRPHGIARASLSPTGSKGQGMSASADLRIQSSGSVGGSIGSRRDDQQQHQPESQAQTAAILEARRQRNKMGLRSIDNFLSTHQSAIGPDSVPEHTWDELAGLTNLSSTSEFRNLIGFIFGDHGSGSGHRGSVSAASATGGGGGSGGMADGGDVFVNGIGADEMVPLGANGRRQSLAVPLLADGGRSRRQSMADPGQQRDQPSNDQEEHHHFQSMDGGEGFDYTYEEIWPATDDVRQACLEAGDSCSSSDMSSPCVSMVADDANVAQALAEAVATEMRRRQ
ncbi:hypothetical protein BC831DRAFT_59538 [Entophlyctis helioformis]|nr:hypothetical protein BC831DRAFT_59538 [Entophlyctis helioformis]